MMICFVFLILNLSLCVTLGDSRMQPMNGTCLTLKDCTNNCHFKAFKMSKDNFVFADVTGSPRWELPPEAPKEFSIDPQNVTLRLKPSKGGIKMIRYYLLKISQETDPPSVSEKYVLLNVTRSSSRKLPTFLYRCLDILRNAYRVKATVWAISDLPTLGYASKHGGILIPYDKYSTRDSSNVRISQGFRDALKEDTACLCHSTVAMNLYIDQPSIRADINIGGLEAGVEIEVQLIRNETTIADKQTHMYQVSTTGMRVSFTNNITEGKYNIRVLRKCRNRVVTPCGNTAADTIISRELMVKIRQGSSDFIKAEEINIDQDRDIVLVLQLALVTCTVGIGLVAITSAIIKTCFDKLGIEKKWASKENGGILHRKHTGDDVESSSPLKVAIIFTRDSDDHVRKVYNLKYELQMKGIDVTTVDEDTHQGLFVNWFDEGEKVASNNHAIIFVVTSQLYEVCHRETGFNNQTNNQHTLKKDTKQTPANTGVTLLHKLPAVVINSLKVRYFVHKMWLPRVYSVCLSEKCTDTIRITEKFHTDHSSLFHSNVYFFPMDTRNILSHDKSFQTLARKIKTLTNTTFFV